MKKIREILSDWADNIGNFIFEHSEVILGILLAGMVIATTILIIVFVKNGSSPETKEIARSIIRYNTNKIIYKY